MYRHIFLYRLSKRIEFHINLAIISNPGYLNLFAGGQEVRDDETPLYNSYVAFSENIISSIVDATVLATARQSITISVYAGTHLILSLSQVWPVCKPN